VVLLVGGEDRDHPVPRLHQRLVGQRVGADGPVGDQDVVRLLSFIERGDLAPEGLGSGDRARTSA
jgi:hypothetical protein